MKWSADRLPLNPLYSDNRLKLGVFGANVSNGCAATTAPGHLEMTWANSSDIVTTADHAGWGGHPLVGTAEQIVDELATLTGIGYDGVVLSWVNYHDEMRQWIAEVMPLIEQAGLRRPHRPG